MMFVIQVKGKLPFENEVLLGSDRFRFRFYLNERFNRIHCEVMKDSEIIYASRLQYSSIFNSMRTGTNLDKHAIFPIDPADIETNKASHETVTADNFPSKVKLVCIEL